MPDQPQTSVNVKSHEFNWIAGQDKLRAETIARLKKADFMLSDKFEFDEADHDTLRKVCMLFPNDLQRLDLVTGYVSGSEDDAKQWMVALIRRLPTTAENDFEVVVCSSEQDDVESAWADFSWKIEEHMGRRLTAKLKVQD